MKRILFFTLIAGFMATCFGASAQKNMDTKAVRPSPADTVKATTTKGIDITIAYSQPSIKGRTIGKEIAPFDGKPWRTGANEETAITISKDVKIEGHDLPAGKYSIWSIPGEKEWVIIINKNTTNWGTQYDAPSDVFRFTVKTQKAPAFTEKMKFEVNKSGKVDFVWGDYLIVFNVK